MRHVIEMRVVYEQADGTRPSGDGTDRERIIYHIFEGLPTVIPDEGGNECATVVEASVFEPRDGGEQ